MGTYLLPVIASIYWLIDGKLNIGITAISILLLNIKLLLFLRLFQYDGKILIIITGVIHEIYPFLAYLFLIILGFAHAFYILLRSSENGGANDPLTLATKYNTFNSDGSINPIPTLIQPPDSNTNLFNWFPTSLLAMYLFLTGNKIGRASCRERV